MFLKSKTQGDNYGAEIARHFGVDIKKAQIGIINYRDNTFKHLSKMDITKFKAEDFLKFVEDFKEGTLPLTFKSDPPIRK
jgi:hypothetical protein